MSDISVLTPSYDYGRFIEDALLSVRSQRGLSVQHVVQDGGSRDETVEILSRHEAYVDWASEPDGGQSDALNKALSRATGKWIAWLNADEFYLPDVLFPLVRAGERVAADVVYGESVLVDEAGRVIRLLPQHRFSPRILKEYGCYISSSSTIFRRAALGDAPWGEDVRRVMDWDLYMRLARNGARFLHVHRPVGAFRVHAAQITAAPHQQFEAEDSVLSERHGRPADASERWRASRIGRWMHPAYKALDGAYLRQWRARLVQGCDLRWFRDDVGDRGVARLLQASYGRPRPGRADARS